MAVIYVPPDPRQQIIGQAIMNAINGVVDAAVKKKKMKNLMDFITNEGTQPGVSDSDASQFGGGASGDQTPSGTPPTKQELAPDKMIAGALNAVGGDMRYMPIINSMVSARVQDERMQMEFAKLQNTLRHQQVTESQGQTRNDIAAQRETRESRSLTLKEKEFPLMMKGRKVQLQKNQEQLAQLQQEQTALWSPEQIHQAVQSWIASGFKQAPNFGWARGASATNRNNFWREALSTDTLSPKQRRQVEIQFEGQQQEARTAAHQLGNLRINMNKAEALMQPLQGALEKITPTLSQAPAFNKFKKAILTGTGDPRFAGADIYVHSFLIAYAKSLNPNGMLAVDFNKMVQQWLDTVSSPQQLQQKLTALRRDMSLEQSSVETGQTQIRDEANPFFGQLGPTQGTNKAAPAQPSQTQNTPAAGPEGPVLETKQVNGVTYYKHSNGWFTE